MLTEYQPRFDVIPADRVEIPRLDADAVARTVLSAYALTQAPPLLALYKAAASVDLFALATLDHLRALGLVFLHCYRRADTAGAFRSVPGSFLLKRVLAPLRAR